MTKEQKNLFSRAEQAWSLQASSKELAVVAKGLDAAKKRNSELKAQVWCLMGTTKEHVYFGFRDTDCCAKVHQAIWQHEYSE